MVGAGIDITIDMVQASEQEMGGIEHGTAFRMYVKEQLLTHALTAYKVEAVLQRTGKRRHQV